MTNKNIGTLIDSLNAKAAAAGEDLTVAHVAIDRTWGDLCGIAITGTGNRERAVTYAWKYFQAHLAGQRRYEAQYAFNDKGEQDGARIVALVYWPCAE